MSKFMLSSNCLDKMAYQRFFSKIRTYAISSIDYNSVCKRASARPSQMLDDTITITSGGINRHTVIFSTRLVLCRRARMNKCRSLGIKTAW